MGGRETEGQRCCDFVRMWGVRPVRGFIFSLLNTTQDHSAEFKTFQTQKEQGMTETESERK